MKHGNPDNLPLDKFTIFYFLHNNSMTALFVLLQARFIHDDENESGSENNFVPQRLVFKRTFKRESIFCELDFRQSVQLSEFFKGAVEMACGRMFLGLATVLQR